MKTKINKPKDAVKSSAKSKQVILKKERASKKLSARIPGATSRELVLRRARKGVPGKTITQVIEQQKVSLSDIALVLGVNEKTVRSYRLKEGLLSAQQAEQLLKYKQLLERGSEVFGSSEAFRRWLQKPAFGLDNDLPQDLLITSEGINLVYDEVERIAYGEFS